MGDTVAALLSGVGASDDNCAVLQSTCIMKLTSLVKDMRMLEFICLASNLVVSGFASSHAAIVRLKLVSSVVWKM